MSRVILGGTFSILHAGHEALLRAAMGSKSILIGLTGDEWMKKHKLHPLVPYSTREKNLARLLARLGLRPRSCIVEINDAFGPAVLDCGADTLVVSRETEKTAGQINLIRRRKGLPALHVISVPLVLAEDGFPISSSRISSGLINSKGRRLAPLRVAVGSNNPSKLKGARSALRRAFPGLRLHLRGFAVSSGVHEQPVGFGKTSQGALNRAKSAARKWPQADYAIGLESGLIPFDGRFFDMQLCVLLSPADGRASTGCSMGFALPQKVQENVFGGSGTGARHSARPLLSLGDAVDSLSGQKNIGRRKGALYFLSRGLMERKEMTVQAVLCAMVERRSPV
ncbi:Phosphopantetheine adenylyltransferase [uncultured archaeon]|nr:Phosphopantetheine adenylyltransferase [uncultured archaeon]